MSKRNDYTPTPKQIDDYIDCEGVACIVCYSDDITNEKDRDDSTQEVSCNSCKATWIECYTCGNEDKLYDVDMVEVVTPNSVRFATEA